MQKPKQHIFVCASFRASGEPQGVCNKKGSIGFLPYLQEGLSDRNMEDVVVSMAGCLKVCDRGPAMVVYPQGYWYGKVENEEAIDEILDALEQGKPAEKYLIG
jgi:(2Fe-2S) ferredoxin